VAAVHLDSAGAEPAVTAAVDALSAASSPADDFRAGSVRRAASSPADDDVEFLIAEAEEHELEWYDVSELDRLPVE
jgi:hypothetical protein